MSPQQIDDDDRRVQYSSGWSQDDAPGSFGSSLHGSAVPGSTATLTFTGTGVEVHGIVTNTRQHPTMTFTVDGGSTITYPAPTVGNKNSMLFFSASGLSSDQHRLVITNQDGSGPIALWLDYFLVDISPTTRVGMTSSASSSTSSSTARVGTTSFASSSTSSSTARVGTTSSASSSTSSTETSLASSATPLSRHIPAIVGGVAGALLVIVAAVLACLWRKRHRRARREKMMRANVQPYVPVVRMISQYRASLYSLDKVPPSLAAGTQSPSVYTSDVDTSATEPARGPRERTGGSHLFSQTPRSKSERGIGLPYTPSDADVPRSPALLRQADWPGQTPPTTAAATVPQPASGLVLPDELGRALSDAPPEVQSSVMSFVHTLFLQGGQRPLGGGVAGEVDSGVRMYDEEYVPPPQYTTR